MKSVKVYGERNTGTNYLENLININFSIDLLRGTVPSYIDRVARKTPFTENVRDQYFRLSQGRNLGWKHREVPFSVIDLLGPNAFIICLVKNPYSWMLSMHRRAYHYHGLVPDRFVDFIASQWRTVGRESSATSYNNIVEMWNIKTASYHRLAETGRCKIKRYEDFLLSPHSELESLKDEFNIPTKVGFPKNYTASAKTGDSGLNTDHYLDYYGNERWRDKLDRESSDYIGRYLDKDLMNMLGYGVL